MKSAVLLHHLGFADLFSCNGIVNHFCEIYDKLYLIVDDVKKKKIVDNMYQHQKNFECIIPEFININPGNESCLRCHTKTTGRFCPRDTQQGCQFVDWAKYKGHEIIKIGCFSEENDWFRYYLDPKNISFSHSFYTFAGLDPNIRIDKFKISNNYLFLENQHLEDNYISIHEDAQRGILIDRNRLNMEPLSKIYLLDQKSDLVVDQIINLQNSKELHFIDSSYSVLIYFLAFHDNKIRQIPKFLHRYTRIGRDTNIYTEPIPDNWNIL